MPVDSRSRSRLLRIAMMFLMIIVANPMLAAAQDTPNATQANAKTVNVELIFDSSGSMAQEVSPGVTRIQAAKDVLNDVVDAIPETEGINVGFRVYGHEGTNQEQDRELSCQSTELIVPIEGVNKDALRGAIESYSPVGWTPITLSLEEAAKDCAGDRWSRDVWRQRL
jgi:D-amino-acid dehydrogenase/Ca-activated chloride channel family protein